MRSSDDATTEKTAPECGYAANGRPTLLCLLTLGLISALAAPQAKAQPCPDPWSGVTGLYGTVNFRGTGNTEHILDINVTSSPSLVGLAGNCQWALANLFFLVDFVTLRDTTRNCPITTTTANGPGFSNIIVIPNFTGTSITGYHLFGQGTVQGTVTVNSCDGFTASGVGDFGWGWTLIDGPTIPFPNALTALSGESQFRASDGVDWDLTWNLSPVPDDTLDNQCHAGGSDVGCQNQTLGESVPITGTPFFLRYQSDRAMGRAGADVVAINDARSMGGWTFNVHHALQRTLQQYCAGGQCTRYAVVPKALFLGDGSTRSDAKVQASVLANSKIYLTSEDGGEVYVFDAASGLHVQTLRPLTGAVRYTFGYNNAGKLTQVTDATGNVTTIQRDANARPMAIVSPYGQTTTLSVDSNGYLSQIADPAGHAINLVTSANGLLASLTDANGNVHSFQYDSLGRLTRDSDPAGGSITLARSDASSGYSVTKTTALGRTTTYAVAFSSTAGSTSHQMTNTWPDGLTATTTETEQQGQLSNSTSLPNGTTSTTSYGPDPRWGIQVPVAISDTLTVGNLTANLSNSRTATLGAQGNPFSLITQTDKSTINNRTYTSVFSAAQKSFVNTTSVGRTSTVVLDALERVSSTQINGLAATTFAYDSRERLATATQSNRQVSLSYRSDGFLASIADRLGRKNSFTYDAGGRLLTRTLADGRVIEYTYDANGNRTAVTPPGKAAHDLSYSSVNLLSSYTPPVATASGATIYSYDADQEITTVTRPDGGIITFIYDSAGRPSSVVTPTSTITYAYSATTGNLASATSTAGESVSYTYNGSLPTESTWTGTVSGSLSRVYDNNFWVTSESIDGGNTVAFAYDSDGLVTEAGTLTIAHSPTNGLITGTTLGLATDVLSYDAVGELVGYSASYNNTSLYHVQLKRDVVGRISGKTETIDGITNNFAYQYDTAGRLTGVIQNGKLVAGYTYDTNSNRLAATNSSGTANGTYDPQDRLLTYGNTSFAYTANGELLSMAAGNQITHYTYDVLGNLTGVTLPSGSNITYVVDPQNRRIGKQVNGALIQGFLYQDGLKPIAEVDHSNNVVSRFVYATRNDVPDYMIKGGVTYRIFTDHLGSPRLVMNVATGAVLQRMDYDEFGQVLNDTNPGFQPFGFAGGLYDRDTKLVRFGTRDYEPNIGRWTAKDPILFAGGDSNLYGYVLNDPINASDPSGLGACSYDQGTGSLVCYDSDTNEIVTGEGYAGQGEGLNNAAAQGAHNVGPLPEGIYTTEPAKNTLNGKPHDTVIPLNPAKSNEMYGRNNFRIHGGDFKNKNSSNGCAVQPLNVRKQVAKSPGTIVQVYNPPPPDLEKLWLFLDDVGTRLRGIK